MEAPPISQHQIQQVLQWLETLTFSRSPKNLTRDFSDGVLMAELMRQHSPSLVQLHNYQPANASAAKYINWKTLNQKVFKKMGFMIQRSDIESIISNTPGAIERVLYMVYTKLLKLQQNANQTQSISLANKLSDMSLSMSKTNTQFSPLKNMPSIQQQHRSNIYARELSSQLAQKQTIIKELRQTIQILEMKMKKMQQLSKLKDAKIDSLMKKLDESIGL